MMELDVRVQWRPSAWRFRWYRDDVHRRTVFLFLGPIEIRRWA